MNTDTAILLLLADLQAQKVDREQQMIDLQGQIAALQAETNG